MNAAPLLAVANLSKSYRRRPILREISLEVFPGEAVAIIGPNGAGKSTFLGCLTGERLPDSGSVRVAGADPFSDPIGATSAMGFVPEQPFLYGELTVAETLRFVAEVRRLDRTEAESETARLLELLNLAAAEGTLCRELSQGMARKVAIIAALMHRPGILILDEVFNGLDQTSTELLVGELDSRRGEGSAVLLSSHDLTLLATWCDRGVLLAPDGWNALEGQAWDEWKSMPRLAAL